MTPPDETTPVDDLWRRRIRRFEDHDIEPTPASSLTQRHGTLIVRFGEELHFLNIFHIVFIEYLL